MSKVLMFSRTFPAYHPKAGRPTFFVEQFYNSICCGSGRWNDTHGFFELDASVIGNKHHTIRVGNRWKVGDKFSPRVWSGKPYRSKMITIASDVEVKKVWDIEICISEVNGKKSAIAAILINNKIKFMWDIIAANDGLCRQDLIDWFYPSAPFKGQIICWSEKVKY